MGLRQALVRHVRQLREPRKLDRSQEVEGALPRQLFKYEFCPRVQVKILVGRVARRQHQLKESVLFLRFRLEGRHWVLLLFLALAVPIHRCRRQEGHRVRHHRSFDIFIDLREGLLNITIGQFLIRVHIQARVRINLHEPAVPVIIHENIEAKDLEASRVLVISAHEAVIGILQIRFERNNRLGNQVVNLPLEEPCVPPLRLQFLVDTCEELLARVRINISKVLVRTHELVRLFVQAVVGQVHI